MVAGNYTDENLPTHARLSVYEDARELDDLELAVMSPMSSVPEQKTSRPATVPNARAARHLTYRFTNDSTSDLPSLSWVSEAVVAVGPDDTGYVLEVTAPATNDDPSLRETILRSFAFR